MILKKLGDEYKLYSHDSCIATTYESPYKKLSLKNCNAIANGYDLEELACNEIGIDISVVNHIDNKVIENDSVSTPIHEAGALGAGLYHMVKGFEIGFQKAFELLGDKKFGENKLLVDFVYFLNDRHFNKYMVDTDEVDLYLESLQQTEWDVIIERETVIKDFNGNVSVSADFKTDANGCLILKRK